MNSTERLDPLKRVLVPIEHRGQFQTHEGMPYRRLASGQIVRAIRKVKGKAARRADKQQRRGVIAPAASQRSDNAQRLITPLKNVSPPSMGGGR